tara:strand:+ start:312 stop:926 length:615 start_codon:yes stop_codon:yes gene_type:complete
MKTIITHKLTLVFATNNQNKIKEVKTFIPKSIKLLSLKDIECNEEIEETGLTIAENALIKSSYIKNNYGYSSFSDDTGLEIDSLNGDPGVFSARYAGTPINSKNNIDLVLKKMKLVQERSAQFRTCISLVTENTNKLFEGVVRGKILEYPKGTNGFGYDSIFKPNFSNKTFAEFSLKEKNEIGHRGIALKKLINYLIKSKTVKI